MVCNVIVHYARQAVPQVNSVCTVCTRLVCVGVQSTACVPVRLVCKVSVLRALLDFAVSYHRPVVTVGVRLHCK